MKCRICGCELDLTQSQGDDIDEPECYACAQGVRVCRSYDCAYYDSWEHVDKCVECVRNEIGTKVRDNFSLSSF